MKLQEKSIQWAINHLFKESDNDLFPRPYELGIIKELEQDVVNLCKEIEIGNYRWKAARRFLIPKDNLSFRNATQLDLIDSIIFGGIIYEYGQLIEDKRRSTTENTVFSYRFKPLDDGTLYSNKNAWEKFWTSARDEAVDYSHIVICDISDFYNQIYLHTIENQLGECGFPNQVIKSLKELIISITQRSSKGIPIGPHCSHLLAEMSLIPFDDNLSLRGIPFKRYVDDIILFCSSEKEARIALNQVAEILDKEQRLTLQRQKTKILASLEFVSLCKSNLLEEASNPAEEAIVDIIKSYSGGNAYTRIKLSEVSNSDLRTLSEHNIVDLLESYLEGSSPNYEKIRWIYRRLSQIGLPHAIDFSIENFDKLIPALNDVCLYINSCAENYTSDWKVVGEQIFEMLEDDIIESNEFYKISLYNLFVYNKNLNHIASLLGVFNRVSENLKRKILFASMNYNSASWLRGLKEQYNRFDTWTKRAYLIAASMLPKEEREYFYKGLKVNLQKDDVLEEIIIKWSKNQ
ncbi:RNA-directed DNA polymerase [Pontibacter vulgaris]|uniref:RNA-directed DNA polymerase n=1 Tax=Pontibacter vulgaris TaxID=2905679 RepID=UPI001FA72363|nr:RNA-directed DNA polymerase [Pontibacter vulgaris]